MSQRATHVGWIWKTCVLLLVTVAGCEPETGEVSGTVRFGDKLLTSGTVTFITAKGEQRATALASDGSYKLDKLPVGPVTITVLSHPRVPPGLLKKAPPGAPSVAPDESKESPVAIPDRYKDPDRSGLTYTVEKGKHIFDIVLKP